MRSRTADWFECKIQYGKMQEDGSVKRTTEVYTVDALSFTEAEQRITEEMSAYISGEFNIADIKKAAYSEVFFCDSEIDNRWYKVKVQFITLDEKTDKEKRCSVVYLVNAESLGMAVKSIEQEMPSASDFSLVSVMETQLLDVFEYKKAEVNDKPEYEQ